MMQKGPKWDKNTWNKQNYTAVHKKYNNAMKGQIIIMYVMTDNFTAFLCKYSAWVWNKFKNKSLYELKKNDIG